MYTYSLLNEIIHYSEYIHDVKMYSYFGVGSGDTIFFVEIRNNILFL